MNDDFMEVTYDKFTFRVRKDYWYHPEECWAKEKDGMITNMTVARDPKTGKQIIALMYYKQEPLPFEEF